MESQKTIENVIEDLQISENENFKLNEITFKKELEDYRSMFSDLAIKVLSVFGGILATSFFMLFLGLSGIFKDESSLFILGLIFMGISILVSQKEFNILLDTSIITLYTIGYFLARSSFIEKDSINDLLFIGIGILTILLTNRALLIFIATLMVNLSFGLLFITFEIYAETQLLSLFYLFIYLFLILNESKIICFNPKLNSLFIPLQAAFFISFLTALNIFTIFENNFIKNELIYSLNLYNILTSIIINLAIIFLIYKINMENKYLIIIMLLLFSIPTIYSPYISGSILTLLISYYFYYKSQIVISILVFIVCILKYYYYLDISLLNKSLILMASGSILVVMWFILNKFSKNYD